MSINIIAACDRNYGIGYKNQLLFRIKEDLQRFKQLTQDQIVIMGRKTFESLPAPLPNRKNVVLTRDEHYKVPNGVIVENSFKRIINHYLETGKQDKELWIIGGSEIYELFMPYADHVYLTMASARAEHVDAYFPVDALKKFFKVDDFQGRYCDECNLSFIYFYFSSKVRGK